MSLHLSECPGRHGTPGSPPDLQTVHWEMTDIIVIAHEAGRCEAEFHQHISLSAGQLLIIRINTLITISCPSCTVLGIGPHNSHSLSSALKSSKLLSAPLAWRAYWSNSRNATSSTIYILFNKWRSCNCRERRLKSSLSRHLLSR